MLRKSFFSFFLLLFFSSPVFALNKPFDHSAFDQFLKKYVTEQGDVDYAGVKQAPELLDQYLKILKKVSWGDFQDWPREEQMALYLNAYHAALIKQVVKYYPISSLQKIPGFWQMDSITIGKKHFGLNGLRKEYLIRFFRDARIHAAISYGAKSSPRLSRDAFTGPAVEGQLLVAARRFVNDNALNQIEPGKKKIYLSKVFEWHPLDFAMNFGAFENEKNLSQQEYAILSFVAHHLENDEKIQFLEEGRYKIKYLAFDWTLNDTRAGKISKSSN